MGKSILRAAVKLGLAVGCLSALLWSTAATGSRLRMAPESALSKQIREAPAAVREAYRFALANPKILQKIPCYCSCETWKHDSNYDCYVEKQSPGNQVVFSAHALG